MGGVGHEPAQPGVAVLESVEHGVHGGGQPVDLVAGAGLGDPFAQRPGVDLLNLLGDLFHRAQSPPGEQPGHQHHGQHRQRGNQPHDRLDAVNASDHIADVGGDHEISAADAAAGEGDLLEGAVRIIVETGAAQLVCEPGWLEPACLVHQVVQAEDGDDRRIHGGRVQQPRLGAVPEGEGRQRAVAQNHRHARLAVRLGDAEQALEVSEAVEVAQGLADAPCLVSQVGGIAGAEPAYLHFPRDVIGRAAVCLSGLLNRECSNRDWLAHQVDQGLDVLSLGGGLVVEHVVEQRLLHPVRAEHGGRYQHQSRGQPHQHGHPDPHRHPGQLHPGPPPSCRHPRQLHLVTW